MAIPTSKRSRILLGGAVGLVMWMLVVWNHHRTVLYMARRQSHHVSGGVENNTLGFERIAVVSTGPSWRIEGLLAAAELTDLEVEVPSQPQWTDFEVDTFRRARAEGKGSKLGPGQAQCWLGHLNVLHEALARGWSTVLIMEDDADWDVRIKEQLSRVAPAILQVTNATDTTDVWSPYGDGWDLLWLGHCGDEVPDDGVWSVVDDSLPESSLYRKTYGDPMYFPPQLRMVYPSLRPVCTYAYAVTAQGAMEIYRRAVGGQDRIITIALREMCKAGVLRCVTVNPELFHHHKKAGEVSSEIAKVEGWDDLAAPATIAFTANVRYSARCNSRSNSLVSCQGKF